MRFLVAVGSDRLIVNNSSGPVILMGADPDPLKCTRINCLLINR